MREPTLPLQSNQLRRVLHVSCTISCLEGQVGVPGMLRNSTYVTEDKIGCHLGHSARLFFCVFGINDFFVFVAAGVPGGSFLFISITYGPGTVRLRKSTMREVSSFFLLFMVPLSRNFDVLIKRANDVVRRRSVRYDH